MAGGMGAKDQMQTSVPNSTIRLLSEYAWKEWSDKPVPMKGAAKPDTVEQAEKRRGVQLTPDILISELTSSMVSILLPKNLISSKYGVVC